MLSLLAAVALTLGISTGAIDHHLTRTLEYAARDLATQARTSSTPHPKIVVVDIQESSLAAVGAWPWPRQTLAALIEKLIVDHQAAIVALDIVLPNPRDAAGDQRLQMLASQKKLVLSQAFDYVERDTPIISGRAAGGSIAQATPPPIKSTGVLANHDGLLQAPCVGNIGYRPDPDGKLRRLIHATEWQGKTYPSLAVAVMRCLSSDAADAPLALPSPTVQMLRFDQAMESWTVIRAEDVLARHRSLPAPVPPALLDQMIAGKIVIVGSSAMGLSDRVATPLSPNTSGMFVHAQAIADLLNSQASNAPESVDLLFQRTSFVWVSAALVVLFDVSLILTQRLFWMITFATGVIVTWVVVFWWASAQTNDLQTTAAVWGFLLSLVLVVPLKWASARKETLATTRLLSRYVSKPVLQELLAQKNSNPLKARQAKITVLVADMASYTELTKTKSLEDIAQITKQFLEAITEPIWALRGTLDRYSGDGLVAFWGAPLESADQADCTVEAALQIQRNLAKLNTALTARGIGPLRARIGIASGNALVGDFGTRFRATYTAVGTCINLATRLEALGKKLQPESSILLSEEAARQLTRHDTLPMGQHDISGLGAVAVFTVHSDTN